MAKAWLLVDLTYGDAGKGATVDFLARCEPVHTVVRFNGGPQAGHNVVTPDGRHHTFSQFGSASFVPGVLTYLSRFVLVNPLNAFREATHLRAVGVPDALDWLVVHPDCLAITPFHVAANRLREIARGARRHGSCGMGVGETVADALAIPDEALRVGDLATPRVVARKLRAVRERKRRELRDLHPWLGGCDPSRCAPASDPSLLSGQACGVGTSDWAEEVYTFFDPCLIDRYVERAQAFVALVAQRDEGWLRTRMKAGVTVFEPAQGTLIDEDCGFHPYTTWSKTTLANAEALLRDTGFSGEVTRVGLLRAYATRHGAGPFVPEDGEMTALLPDPYNPPGAWQGAMRCGPFDCIATRYALAANPGVDWLAISHLDCLGGFVAGWPFCRRYAHEGPAQPALATYDGDGRVAGLRHARQPDLAYQARLTDLLGQCTPVVERAHPDELVDLVEQEAGRRVGLCAWGPTARDRVARQSVDHAGHVDGQRRATKNEERRTKNEERRTEDGGRRTGRMSTVRFRAALVVVTLAGFALRVYGLGRQSFWLDEVDAIAMAGEPVAAHLRKLSATGENGPLYFLLFKGWIALAGAGEFGARYLSALCSTAAIPLLGALTYRLTGQAPAAVCAALLAAVSPFYVWYGQDAKMYPLFALLALAAQYCLLRGWSFRGGRGDAETRRRGESPPRVPVSPCPRISTSWPWWLGYVVTSSLALYVHLFAALQIVANTVAGLVLWRRLPAGRRAFCWATLALVAPYVPLAVWQAPLLLSGADVGYRPASLPVIVVGLLEQMTWHLRYPADRRTLVPLGLIAACGLWRLVRTSACGHYAYGGGSINGRGRAPAALMLLAWLLVPVALVLAIQGRVPVFRDRYLIPLLAPFLVLLARAVAPPWSAGGPVSAAAAAFLAVGFGYGLAHRPPNPDFRAAAEFVRSTARPEDQVGFLARYAERPFEFYFRQGPGSYVKVTLPYTNYPTMDEREGLLAVASSLRGGRRLWIVRFEDWLWDSRNLAGEYLANRGAQITLERDFDGVSVTRYELPG